MNLIILRIRLGLQRQSIGNLCAVFLLFIVLCAWFIWLPHLREKRDAIQIDIVKAQQALNKPPPAVVAVEIPVGEKNLDNFYKTLGERQQTEQQLKILFSIAKKQGLVLTQGEYKTSAEINGRYLKYQILLPVKGSYSVIRKFVEQVLLMIPFASLDELNFKRDNINNKVLEAKLRFTLYLSINAEVKGDQ
jgi:hypothetical protein